MRRRVRHVSMSTEVPTTPGPGPVNPPEDALRHASRVLARMAVRQYLALTNGGRRDETTQDPQHHHPEAS